MQTHHPAVGDWRVKSAGLSCELSYTASSRRARCCRLTNLNVRENVKLPDDKALIVGVIDTKTNSVEHPELVAQRLERFANIVGKERVIAGTDCGFATFVGFHPCHPEAAWLKLRALVEGAQLASQRLW